MLRCPPPATVEITPTGPLRASVRPSGSASITHRALMCAAMAEGESRLVGACAAEDTRVLLNGLRRLGVAIEADDGGTRLSVQGCGGRIPASEAELDVPNSIATMGFLAAAASSGCGSYRFAGSRWARDRSLQDMLSALAHLGVHACIESNGGPPHLSVSGHGLSGGTARLGRHASGQLLCWLLLVAPCARDPVQVRLAERKAFQPQILSTLAVMRAFDVDVPAGRDLLQIDVGAPQSYRGQRYVVEPDALAACCFWSAAAITRGIITVEGISLGALQTEVAFCNCLQRMGCRVDYGPQSITVAGNRLRGIAADRRVLGSTWPALTAAALFAEGPTTITGLNWADADEAELAGRVVRELRKLGATVETASAELRIVPGTVRPAEIDPGDDYRLAMSLALVGLRTPGVAIREPVCTESRYPRFFEELMALGD